MPYSVIKLNFSKEVFICLSEWMYIVRDDGKEAGCRVGSGGRQGDEDFW